MNKKESQHFAKLWALIECSILDAFSNCSDDFKRECKLRSIDSMDMDKLKNAVEHEYRHLRKNLKHECYGRNEKAQNLDARKIAAVICCALIQKKVLIFDETKAIELLKEQVHLLNQQENPDRTILNMWIANNFFINYKIAYLAGLRIIFNTLLGELIDRDETREIGRKLATKGCLFQYPRIPQLDDFDVSMVLGLGRSDIKRDNISPFMLALQFYQIEMYTRRMLGLDCLNEYVN